MIDGQQPAEVAPANGATGQKARPPGGGADVRGPVPTPLLLPGAWPFFLKFPAPARTCQRRRAPAARCVSSGAPGTLLEAPVRVCRQNKKCQRRHVYCHTQCQFHAPCCTCLCRLICIKGGMLLPHAVSALGRLAPRRRSPVPAEGFGERSQNRPAQLSCFCRALCELQGACVPCRGRLDLSQNRQLALRPLASFCSRLC